MASDLSIKGPLRGNWQWLRLVSQRLIECEGKHYTHEVWVDAKGTPTEEYVPRERIYVQGPS